MVLEGIQIEFQTIGRRAVSESQGLHQAVEDLWNFLDFLGRARMISKRLVEEPEKWKHPGIQFDPESSRRVNQQNPW